MKQTADVNRKYWNFRFDTETSRWVFSYHHLKIVPGYTWYGSTFNELAKNTPGELTQRKKCADSKDVEFNSEQFRSLQKSKKSHVILRRREFMAKKCYFCNV